MVQPTASVASAGKSTVLSPRGFYTGIYIMHEVHSLHQSSDLFCSLESESTMKNVFLLLFVLGACSAAPAPAPVPAPSPKADPSLLYATPLLAAPPAVSYSTVYKAPPSYPVYTPYVYNLGYASAYPYSVHPSYYII